MKSFLEFFEVTHRFGRVKALDHVTLGVREGEIFGLLGPSGCGKTTLLRIAGGFCGPSAGSIHLGGQDITHLPPEKRPVNTVFQNYALFPHLNVWENIAFGLRMAKKPKRAIESGVNHMLALIQMEDHAQKRPDEISGGQRQRVAIGRALVNEPKVLLLDEPLAALDLKLRQRMLGELSKIHEKVGTTFLFVTHDQGEAMSLCDRIAVMNNGRVEQIGTPEEIYSAPATSFVASFIGDTNFLPGFITVTEADGVAKITMPGWPEVPATIAARPSMGDHVLLGLRPEQVALSSQKPEPSTGQISVEGIVTDITFLGSSSRYLLQVGEVQLASLVLHDKQHELSTLKRGGKAWATFHTSELRLVKGSISDL